MVESVLTETNQPWLRNRCLTELNQDLHNLVKDKVNGTVYHCGQSGRLQLCFTSFLHFLKLQFGLELEFKSNQKNGNVRDFLQCVCDSGVFRSWV